MRKQWGLYASALVVTLVTMTAAASAQPYVCGDADGNEIVNIADAVCLISYIFGGGTAPDPLESGDADGNEIVNIADAVYLISYIFGGGPAPCTVTDVDGFVYQTIKIGDQWWMKENLKATHYRSGDPIPHVTDNSNWQVLSTGAYCDFANDEANVAVYGRLYNWYAVDDSRSIAPAGWHVPTDDEWKQLEMYLGMNQAQADFDGLRGTDEGGKLKEEGTAHWNPPNEGATDESGFSALPGGNRISDGTFANIGYGAFFWTSSEYGISVAWHRSLYYQHSRIYRTRQARLEGFSIRCVRD